MTLDELFGHSLGLLRRTATGYEEVEYPGYTRLPVGSPNPDTGNYEWAKLPPGHPIAVSGIGLFNYAGTRIDMLKVYPEHLAASPMVPCLPLSLMKAR